MISNALIAELSKYGPTPLLLARIVEEAKRKKIALHLLFSDPSAPAILRMAAQQPEVQALIAADQTGEPSTRRFPANQSPRDARDNAVALMGAHFACTTPDRGGMRLYRIRDRDALVLTPIERNDDEEYEISHLLAPSLEATDDILPIAKIREIKNWFLQYGERISRPKLCAQPQEHVWCLHKVSIVPDDTGLNDPQNSFPATWGFLSRLSDPEAFAAWVYGVYSGLYEGRQILWLQGEGADGKSKWMKAFNEAIFGGVGGVGGVVQNATLKNSASFVASLFVDKRFVYVPDNSNPRLLMSEVFKSLADPGADPVVVNHKYGKMYTDTMEAHVAILSNHAPEITDEAWVKTRTLWMTIDPLPANTVKDTRIDEKFKAELPAFLAYARVCYDALCVAHSEIRTNDAVEGMVADQIEDSNVAYTVMLDQFFALDPEGTIKPTDLYAILTGEGYTQFDVRDFKTWLRATYRIRTVRPDGSASPRVLKGIRRKMPSDASIRQAISVGRAAR